MMMGLKKIFREELLQIAILVSLMRVDPVSYLGHLPQPVRIGTDDSRNDSAWSGDPVVADSRRFYIHPKCIEYERDLFEDLNALGRYNRISRHSNVTAYLLNVNGTSGVDLEEVDVASSPVSAVSVSPPREESAAADAVSLPEELFVAEDELWLNPKEEGLPEYLETELTQEDVDLIEVLWKQDVDLGFSLNAFSPPKEEDEEEEEEKKFEAEGTAADDDDEIEKLKALEDITSSGLEAFGITIKDEEYDEEEEEEEETDPWSGLSYTVDLETGEYIIKDEIVDDLDIKDEIAKDLGLKDEITSALEEHREDGSGDASASAEAEDRVRRVESVERISQGEEDKKRRRKEAAGEEVEDRCRLPSGSLSEDSECLLRRLSEENGPVDLPTVSLEEALQLAGLDDPQQDLERIRLNEDRRGGSNNSGNISSTIKSEVDDEDDFLNEMIQTAQFHAPQAPHPRSFQGRMPFVRTMSMEQRWQDLANLLSLPGQEGVGMHHHPFAHHPHHHHHHPNYASHNYAHDGRGVLLHNATLAPPMGDLNTSGPYNAASMGSSNLGSAVATSMNLANSSEPIPDGGTVFKMESPHDLMYYQNSTSEMNQTTEGFLSSILNDEDLQLMDMAMTEGMYPMRMLESNNAGSGSGHGATVGHTEERLDASSDSAVSSMGSERVPSLSDGEWMETGSDSGHNTGDHYSGVDYHASKFRPFDYSYTSRQLLGGSGPSAGGANPGPADGHIPPVAQKKHHMFGKRYFQEQGSSAAPSLPAQRGITSLPTAPAPAPVKYEYEAESVVPPGFTAEPSCGAKMPEVKYSCSLDFIRHQTGARSLEHVHHNHTYTLPMEGTVTVPRASHREKPAGRGRKSEEDHLTRDEKRANAMNIPMPVDEIVNLPMDEFNERLSKYDLSEAQLSLIRDIRRRGKNKVAAQNCRKRKLDQINSLADEVKQMRDRKLRLLRERDYMMGERLRVKEKFSQLYRHVFQALRDSDGNHYSPYEYSLQQSADGTVVLVPRSNSNTLLEQEAPRVKHKDQTHHDQQHKE